ALWIHPPAAPTRSARTGAPHDFPKVITLPGHERREETAGRRAILATSEAFSATAALIRSFPGFASAIPSSLESSAKVTAAPPAPPSCRRGAAFAFSSRFQTDVVEQPRSADSASRATPPK